MAKAKRLPSGNWRVNLYIGMENGKRKYKSFTAPTRKEAEYQAARFAATKQEDNKSETLLSTAIEEYIKSKENILSPSTVVGYCSILNNGLPDLFCLKIKDITQEKVQIAFNQYAINHSAKSCKNAHGLISAVLKIHRPDLTLRTTLPKGRKREIYVPDNQEVERIAKLAVGTSVYVPFLLATQCGLRASEISGLELKDVHEDYIEITQARVAGKGGDIVKLPKSQAGFRRIPIDGELYTILLENADGERVCRQRGVNICNNWAKFRKKHDLNKSLNFHALRHHFASKCLLLGIPQRYVAELIGHSDTAITERIYQHTFPSAMAQYANKLRQCEAGFLDATRNATQDK